MSATAVILWFAWKQICVYQNPQWDPKWNVVESKWIETKTYELNHFSDWLELNFILVVPISMINLWLFGWPSALKTRPYFCLARVCDNFIAIILAVIIRCPLWFQILIDIYIFIYTHIYIYIYHYRILTTDTPRLAHKSNPWGNPYEFNVLHYYRPFLLVHLHLVIFFLR